MTTRKIYLALAFLVSVMFYVFPAIAEETRGPRQLTFLPQWLPQAQFIGYYMAEEKGFYEKRGLKTTIIQGGPARSPSRYLEEKKADIVTLWLSTALQLADRGVDLVNIGQIVRRSSLMLVAKTSSGIRSPSDMNGKKIALWPADFQIQPKAFFDKFQLKVKIVTTQDPVNLFLRDGVQVSSVMWYNEYHTLINSGLDREQMHLFSFEDYGLNFPEDGIYMLRAAFLANPEVACDFVDASLEGWRYAFAHPDEAVDLIVRIMGAAHIPANRVHQRWMLERMRDLSVSAAGKMGDLQPEDYQRVGDILVARGLIKKAPSFADFFMRCTVHDQR